jgi:cytochrome d ubiquinol oxidase subunit I
MSASTHGVGYMIFSLIGFVALYTAFIIAEMYLMLRAIRKGPDDPRAGGAGSPDDDALLDGGSLAARPDGYAEV